MTLSNFCKKLFSRIVVFNCLGMIAAGALLTFASFYLIQCYTDHGETVTVPNVRGQKFDVAQKKLEALGLRCEVVDTGYVDTYVGDVVLEQAIAPGEEVKPGRLIQLTINASSARAIALPSLANNSSFREAKMKLMALGFKNLRVEYTPGDRDWVFDIRVNGQSIHAGTRIPVTTLISIVIGDGSTEEEFNGNDSLDQEYFPTVPEEEEITEDGGGDETDGETTTEETNGE